MSGRESFKTNAETNAKVDSLTWKDAQLVFSNYYARDNDPDLPWISPLYGEELAKACCTAIRPVRRSPPGQHKPKLGNDESASILAILYPLTAPSIMAWKKMRRVKRNSTTTGSAIKIQAAATTWKLIMFWLRKSYKPNMAGLRLFLAINK